MCIRAFKFGIVALTLLGIISCATRPQDSDGPEPISFLVADDFKPGVTVDSITATKTSSTAFFVFDVTSDAERGMSFFNPPGGDAISIQERVPTGRSSIEIAVPISKLRRVDNITVNFYVPAVEGTGSLFLDFGEILRFIR